MVNSNLYNDFDLDEYTNIVIDEKCEHLGKDVCTKRIFKVFDIENMQMVKIHVCNEKLRLLYNQFCDENRYKRIDDFIEYYLKQYIKLYKSEVDKYKYVGNTANLWVLASIRPRIYHQISVIDYAKILYKNNRSEELKLRYYLMCKNFTELLKYWNNKRYSSILSTVRALNNFQYDKDLFLNMVNQLILNLLNIKINNYGISHKNNSK